jgi:hypothetical protein
VAWPSCTAGEADRISGGRAIHACQVAGLIGAQRHIVAADIACARHHLQRSRHGQLPLLPGMVTLVVEDVAENVAAWVWAGSGARGAQRELLLPDAAPSRY